MAAKKKAKKATVKDAHRRRPARGVKKTARKKAPPRKAASRPSTPRETATRVFVVRQQPEGLRLRSAGPSFTVSDIQASLAFYRDVLGFHPKERWEQDGALLGVEMVAGAVSFWLGQDDWKKGRDRAKGQGFRMYCSTAQDIDALASRIRRHGGTLVEEPKDQPWGGRDFAVRDPDGFLITFASGL
jgi:catechol 2,3-dioxygenase-like lactoylglutathione lyase family enzyme